MAPALPREISKFIHPGNDDNVTAVAESPALQHDQDPYLLDVFIALPRVYYTPMDLGRTDNDST